MHTTTTRGEQLDANSLAQLTLDSLSEKQLPSRAMLSQCYDGANVMSVRDVQTIIKQVLGCEVPCVDCFNHRLHLVVVVSICTVPFSHSTLTRQGYSAISSRSLKLLPVIEEHIV